MQQAVADHKHQIGSSLLSYFSMPCFSYSLKQCLLDSINVLTDSTAATAELRSNGGAAACN